MKCRQFRVKLVSRTLVCTMIPAFICVYSLLLLSMGSEELLHEHHLLQKNATRKVVPSSDEKPMGRFPCGHQGCAATKPGLINVHIMPHSHDDPGYKKTTDELFDGVKVDLHNRDISFVSVDFIINNVVDELALNSDRRFMYSEMAFFKKWWDKQGAEKRDVMRRLVQTGQWEFVNGGWTENDEATTLYSDIIDQMSLGLMFLNETFGECGRPRAATQIDTFGHSKEQAFLYAQMGFDSVFVGRIDEQDRLQREKNKELEMIWSGNGRYGVEGEVFLSNLYSANAPPGWLCFDNLCGNAEKSVPIIDDKQSDQYNMNEAVDKFLRVCEDVRRLYATNHIYMTLGSDYTYQDARVWFDSIDKLIKYVNERQVNGSMFHALYSTPSCYTKAVQETGYSFPYVIHDFLPISKYVNSFWTGFFTSRPALKYMVRYAGNVLQSCKQMAAALALKTAPNGGDISVLKEAVAALQHHDGITGTQRQSVTDNYYEMLHKGVAQCRETQTSYYKNELPVGSGSTWTSMSYCQLNVSQCEITEQNTRFVVNVYNGLSRSVDRYVRFPVSDVVSSYRVIDSNGSVIPSQKLPIPDPVRRIPGRNSSVASELVFLAVQLPPMGSKSFLVEPGADQYKPNPLQTADDDSCCSDRVISNDKVEVKVDSNTGLIESVVSNERTVQLKQELLWYTPMLDKENCSNIQNPGSGIYIFRPNGTLPHKIVDGAVRTTVYRGELVQEIHQVYNEWVSQVIRLYRGQEHIELDWLVGPIPVENDIGKEIVSVVTTDLDSGTEFYTQSNGRQHLKHSLDVRDSYDFETNETVAANYYPINSNIHVKNKADGYQMTIIADRAQGGSSLESGQLEVMVHRRLICDDFCLMYEFLDETAYGQGLVARGTHFLVLSEQKDSPRIVRSLSQEMYSQPLLSFVATDLSFDQWTAKHKTQVGILSRSLPANVNILTLEPLSDGRFLFRLEHIFDVDEDPVLSKPVTVSLKGLFDGFQVTSMEETSLAGNMPKKGLQRLRWMTSAHSASTKRESIAASQAEATVDAVELQPMQIRTFVISIATL